MALSKIATAVAGVTFAVVSMGSAQAAVLKLDVGGANVFSFTDFQASGSAVGGAIVAGRDISLSGYSVNGSNAGAYGGYSVIAGRDFTFSNGSVSNGATYVGGVANVAPSGSLASPATGGAAPVNIGALAASLTQTSQSLAALTATAVAEQQSNGIFIAGSGSAVEVINLDASWLNSSSYYNISNVAAGATLIVNFAGDSATFANGYEAFNGYNVLFNLANATTVNIGTGLQANLLAPRASVTGGGGGIDGTVIVNSWDSSVGIRTGAGFAAVDVPGLVLPSVVPEAETWAMLVAGLGLVGFMSRRRQSVASR
ncbi:MAG: choice-of-anchor A family protein [Duganella sp.]